MQVQTTAASRFRRSQLDLSIHCSTRELDVNVPDNKHYVLSLLSKIIERVQSHFAISVPATVGINLVASGNPSSQEKMACRHPSSLRIRTSDPSDFHHVQVYSRLFQSSS